MELFIEAESFGEKGGWVVDSQSMETIHSAYLMAHGMGKPVKDAKTEFAIERDGEYIVWALTRDWTSVWDVKDPAGKFRIIADGIVLPETLGTNGKEWAWQKAGRIFLAKGKHTLALHDLTGFNGRCDAIYITDDENIPDSSRKEIEKLRKRNRKEIQSDTDLYDLIVVGGGIAGICTALSAIRNGLSTLLIHDRSVLGGCNSSEVRVCMGGKINLPPYPHLGDVVREIAPIMGDPNLFDARYYEDDRKLSAFEVSGAKESVLLNHRVTEVEMTDGKISSVVCTDVLTGMKTRYFAKLFSDCTGDAFLSRAAGCSVMYGRESADTFGESLAPEKNDRLVMGHSIRWYSQKEEEPTDFPDIDWNLHFDDNTCLNVYNGDWEQETGFSRDMVNEIEYIRDFGLRAVYSNWSYQKNHFAKKNLFSNYSLKWVSPIGGKRESYRVVGAYVLTQNDIENHVPHEDATCCMTWSIDMHFPEQDNAALFSEPFRSFAYHRGIVKPYPIPYRCLYSAEVPNLFLGGRIVSASHVAFSAIRVMRTLGELGEVVGMAAAVCKEHNCDPSSVYSEYLSELIQKMTDGVKIPCAFECEVGSEEAYHFKDIGWLYLPEGKCDAKNVEKFKRGIKALGIRHKYSLPEKFQ